MTERLATVGMFDGVHRGHRWLLEQLRREAAARGWHPVLITFANHPLTLTNPTKTPQMLMTAEERNDTIRALGVTPVELTFSPQLRAMKAEEFLTMIRRKYGVKALMMGYNNRIGSDRLGDDSPQLAEAACRAGVELIPVPAYPEAAVSSSAVRRLVAEGDVAGAAELLGRPYVVEGKVGSGRQLGRTIGFPTANVEPPAGQLLPASGVYAARALGHRAVVNIGRRPTVETSADAPIWVEVHLIGFQGNLYGKKLRVEFLRRLRGEQKFASLNELKSAIANDIKEAER